MMVALFFSLQLFNDTALVFRPLIYYGLVKKSAARPCNFGPSFLQLYVTTLQN